MTVAEAQDRVGRAEFVEWIAYFRVKDDPTFATPDPTPREIATWFGGGRKE